VSPGATFERVYNELKRMLAEGELPPGTPIEPAPIGKQIASSITPIRDALHRLTGERLVEAPNHNGFRVPLPTEASLRDMYAWNATLLILAFRKAPQNPELRRTSTIEAASGGSITAGELFAEIARATGSGEHLRAIERLNDRLSPPRRVEAILFDDLAVELQALRHDVAGAGPSSRAALARYHRRRIRAVPEIVARLRGINA